MLAAADVLGMGGIVAMMVLLCVFGLFALIMPLFHILGQWAGLRVLQGHDYRYPLIGRLVENWLIKDQVNSIDQVYSKIVCS